jgi:hypothetical protein
LLAQAKGLEPASPMFQFLWSCLKGQDVLTRTLDDIKTYPGRSLDAFLDHRKQWPQIFETGKLILAALLGQAIVYAAEKKAADDWIESVITRMARDASDATEFAKGVRRVTFLTFNFDSIIEQRTARAIERTYSPQDAGLPEALRSINVVHLHGQLPQIPEAKFYIGDNFTSGYTPSGVSGEWMEWAKVAATHIRLARDKDLDESVLTSAKTYVGESKVLCLLGLNYDSQNLAKIGIPELLSKDGYQHFYGSAFRLSDGEREEAKSLFPSYPGRTTSINLGAANDTCKGLLGRFHVLR